MVTVSPSANLNAPWRSTGPQLTDEIRQQLLTISSATADRLLRPYRVLPRTRSMTRAGTLLKKQIPIRTFHDWDDAQPGFLDIDVVAHCGTLYKGSYLSTLTLTDVATGWTECVPLLHRGQALVIQALDRARQLLPFPMLGLDTDNGGEFINAEVLAYCEREQITAWLNANPERTGVSLFQQLQDLYPGRFRDTQVRTLQRGLQKLRACLLVTFDDQGTQESLNGQLAAPVLHAMAVMEVP